MVLSGGLGAVTVEIRDEEFFERMAVLLGKPKGNAICHSGKNILYVTEEVYQQIVNAEGLKNGETIH